MKKRKKMEQSDSTSIATPYELATLASRISPERCAKDPSGAVDHALVVLSAAKTALWREKEQEKEWEAEEKAFCGARKDWLRGIKQITGERRRDRATTRFTEFMEHKAPGNDLSHYQRDGFTLIEIHEFEDDFIGWKNQPKRKKGKQGHRKSESDGRLRTELVGLVPTKPRKSA
jgi:hypothetical protein